MPRNNKRTTAGSAPAEDDNERQRLLSLLARGESPSSVAPGSEDGLGSIPLAKLLDYLRDPTFLTELVLKRAEPERARRATADEVGAAALETLRRAVPDDP